MLNKLLNFTSNFGLNITKDKVLIVIENEKKNCLFKLKVGKNFYKIKKIKNIFKSKFECLCYSRCLEWDI